MTMRLNMIVAAAVGVATGCAAGAATAQDGPRPPQAGQSVQQSYDPVGLRAGAFTFFPKVEVNETYNSNIYATQSSVKSDYITTVSPELRVSSDWTRHSLGFNAGADVVKYASHGDEDYNNYNAAVNGRIDITKSTALNADAGYKILHEDRGSADATNGIEPTEYSVANAKLKGTHEANRFRIALGGTVDKYDYKNVAKQGGGEVDNDARDRIETGESLRLGYEMKTGYIAFVQGALNQRNYRQIGTTGYDRDSKGYQVDGGVALELSDLVIGDIFLGYMNQDYSDARFKTISGLSAGVGLTWTPTKLTTVKPSVSRTISETITTGASGYVVTTYGVGVTHELLRNLVLDGSVQYINNDYHGVDKQEDFIKTDVSAKYLFNRNFYVGPQWQYTNKDSNQADSDYTRHKVLLKVGAQL